MSWSLEKESALRHLTQTYGVLYADALHALSEVEDDQVYTVVERLRERAFDEDRQR